MGTTSIAPRGAAEALFSPVQGRLLGLLYSQPDREFQSADLIRMVGAGTGAAHRQLRQLTEAGLLSVVPHGSQKFYRANQESPIFAELRSIVLKTVGLVQPLRDALEPIREAIRVAFVFGSIAKETASAKSDVDLLIISDSLDYPQVFESVQHVEPVLARRINPTVMSSADWRRKRSDADSFVSRVLDEPRIWVVGSDDELP